MVKKRYDKSDVLWGLKFGVGVGVVWCVVVWYFSPCLDSGRAIFFSHNWQCRDLFIVCIYAIHRHIIQVSVWVSPRLAHTHTHVPPTFTPHTKGKWYYQWGRRRRRRPPSVLSVPLCVWCGTCVLGSGTLYLNNMSVYCTYIHTTYDFCMDNCGWRIWFLSQFWLKNMPSGSIFWLKNLILETICYTFDKNWT